MLSISEIRDICRAVEALEALEATYYRVLIMTVQRTGEVAKMRWSQLDLDQRRWSLPSLRTKNGQPHIAHLSEPACREIRALKRLGHSGDFVFLSQGSAPISISSKMRDALRRAVNKHRMNTNGSAVQPMEDWTQLDIRTAFATALNEDGHQEAVVDRAINHVGSASRAWTVSRVYNRAQLLPQRAAALERWAEIVVGRSNEP